MTSPLEILPPKTKNLFFSILTASLAESVDGLDSSITWRVIGLQSSARFGAFGRLKGLRRIAFGLNIENYI